MLFHKHLNNLNNYSWYLDLTNIFKLRHASVMKIQEQIELQENFIN